MGLFEHWPYVNFHELNMDWIIQLIVEFKKEYAQFKIDWANIQNDWELQQQAFQALQNFVNDYFDNLDVQEEINNKLDEMYQDGSLFDLMKPYIDEVIQNKFNIVTPEMYGAAGDGTTDDSSSIIAAFTSDKPVFLSGLYAVNIGQTPLVTLSNKTSFYLIGPGKIINASTNIVNTDSALIKFINCSNINASLKYRGVDTFDASRTSEEQYGESVFRFENCNDINIDLNAEKCRYGVCFGEYNKKTNLCKNIKITGSSENVCFFAALYGAENIEIDCVCEHLHRSVYLAGCSNFEIRNVYNHQYISDINILCTNEYKNGIMCGCDNGKISCSEFPEAVQNVTESKNAGFSIIDQNRTDDLTAPVNFTNIDFYIDVNSSSGGFGVISTPGNHVVSMENIGVKVETHGQNSFTVFRNANTFNFNGYITIKDSDILNYGCLLLSGKYVLDNSKIYASSGATKANLVLKNNSFATGLYDAIVDITSGFGYPTTNTNEVYKNGNLLTSAYFSNTTNDTFSVTGGDLLMLSIEAVVKLIDNNTLAETYKAGNIIEIPTGTYTASLNNNKKTVVSVAR